MLREEVNALVSELEKRIKIDTAELHGCPKGSLLSTKNEGRIRIYRVTYNKGKRKRQTINDDTEIISALLRREYLEDELKGLTRNRELLKDFLKQMDPMDSTAIMRNLMKRYPWMTGEQLKTAVTAPDAGDERWNSSPLNQSDYKEEFLHHITSWGLRVRSKSELVIAEMLHRYGICFKYETELELDSFSVHPDFQIRRSDGKIIWWEHRGLMNDPGYAVKQQKKDILYEGQGIVPWENLIVTYDNHDGEINLKIVEAMIQAWLL